MVATLAAAALLLYRGPVSALREGNADFALVYSSARAWLVGLNPYRVEDTRRAWQEAGGTPGMDQSARGSAVLLYPPATFVLLAPIAALPWPVAGPAWVALGVVLWLAALRATAAIAGLTWASAAGRMFWILGLAFAPAHTCIKHGQFAVAAVAMVALAGATRRMGAAAWPMAGALLGLGAAAKPQVAAVFTVYEAGRRRWRAAAVSAAVVAALLAIGTGRMLAAGVPGWSSWRANLAEFTVAADGDPTRANTGTRHHLLNLHYPLHTLTDDRDLVRWLVYALVAALCAAYALADRRKPERRGDISALAVAGVATLLVVYHRFYDASVLIFALAWACAAALQGDARTERRLGIAGLVMLAPFLVPGGGAVLLKLAELRGHAPAWLTQRPILWDFVVLPHATWAMVGLAVVLILARARRREAAPDLSARAAPVA